MGAENAVVRWFGPQFAALDPKLQALHRADSSLRGSVRIFVGSGIAGWLGRRLARRIGIPIDRPERGFEVRIVHDARSLEWVRRFDDGSVVRSHFEPVGCWPSGCWRETTGPFALDLAVDVVDGGWQWRPLRARWRGLPVPLCLLPRTRAGKRIVEGGYAFEVAFDVPLCGRILAYSGTLSAECGSPPATS
ncbi:MAG TPA: DUF4166 domain-containing protein [Rudaea sp.]|nr:DUF4166 domain-containing protein [Rudaea sp.]